MKQVCLFRYICPDHHYLESWNDAEPKKDFYSLMQPAISPIFDTRQMADTLLKWSGSQMNFYDFIYAYWADNLMKRQSEFHDPVAFFDHTLQKGIFEPVPATLENAVKTEKSGSSPFNLASINVHCFNKY